MEKFVLTSGRRPRLAWRGRTGRWRAGGAVAAAGPEHTP